MEFIKQYLVLFKKAKADLSAAKLLCDEFNKGDTELDLEVIMFHLQQCAEKLLKSLLAFNKLHFTKTHSIENLIYAAHSNKIKLIIDAEKLILLSEFAIEGRYSIILDDLDKTDEYIKILDKFLVFVEKRIEC